MLVCSRLVLYQSTYSAVAAGIWEYWASFGHMAEAAAWLEEALAREGGPEQARAVALIGCTSGEPERGREPVRGGQRVLPAVTGPARRGEGLDQPGLRPRPVRRCRRRGRGQ